MKSKLYVGIDLGTTNSSLSFMGDDSHTVPEVLHIPQIQKPGIVSTLPVLPSAMYIPFEGEFDAVDFSMPFQVPKDCVVGIYAKERSSEVPDRVVTSAKSWLCQNHADRKGEILPWQSDIAELKVSPFFVASSLLEHMRHSYENAFKMRNYQEEVVGVITVPASFDEIARSLTLEAAHKAGYSSFSLLEEPLAAFYAWLSLHEENWRNILQIGDIIFVCDIGGGTADFTLIYVGEKEGELHLERLSVGAHLLLGGDNMDLALAHVLSEKIKNAGKNIDYWQFQSLIHQARIAKERILSEEVSEVPISIVGKGSSLFSSAIGTTLTKDDVMAVVVEGFFPRISLSEATVDTDDIGIVEDGLPYESDPAITKHIGEFLKKSAAQLLHNPRVLDSIKEKISAGAIFPNYILFNGGVCSSRGITKRICEVLDFWGAGNIKELEGINLHSAVSQGASYYAKIKSSGKGIKVKAGVPRAYYLGLKSSAMAVPGMKPKMRAICVVPQGMEEGTQTTETTQVFNLLTGREVSFRLFTSDARSTDFFGDVVEDAETLLTETTRLSVTLPQATDTQSRAVPVKLYSKVNELGILELWMHSQVDDQQWQLEFDIRTEKKTPITMRNINNEHMSL